MLNTTFRHLPGIGKIREEQLWMSGTESWDDLLAQHKDYQLALFPGIRTSPIREDLLASKSALSEEDAEFFADRLPPSEYYRIALSFFEKTMFLDIETTGLSLYYDYITLIGWTLGTRFNVLIKGDWFDDFELALSNAKAIVTFNGSRFDIPFLKKEFPGISIPSSHIDLRYFAKRVGLKGGQKEVEKSINFHRPDRLIDIDGKKAVLLWYKYVRGDLNALQTLITYNYFDIIGMHYIFDKVVEKWMTEQSIPDRFLDVYRFSDNVVNLPSMGSSTASEIKLIKYPETPLKIHINDLIKEQLSTLKVVGIDLTGSENRPSGWCFLEGNKVQTQLIRSDEDLVEETLKANPMMVSIDSPLSLPEGRKTVFNDDPTREKYGITRYCERVLMKRGVNVYPCLIESMQRLTARGTTLADRFRKMGMPVIESFPGAAQDILNIPRKRDSVDLLKQGLSDFGLEGNFLAHDVNHDELDAITSAVVGVFFWGGVYEALGNEGEDYLIIPDLAADNKWGYRKIIGLSGPTAAGKTTAGKFLESKNFFYTRFSQLLANLLVEKGIEPSRQNLQEFGKSVHEHPGQRWLCKELVKRVPSNQNVVIDGLRHPTDHAHFIESFGPDFLHIHIVASKTVRQQRYIELRGVTPEEFTRAETHPAESNVGKLRELAHSIVKNNADLQQFIKQISSMSNVR